MLEDVLARRKARALPSTRWGRTAPDPMTLGSCTAGRHPSLPHAECLMLKKSIEVQGLGPCRVQGSALAFSFFERGRSR